MVIEDTELSFSSVGDILSVIGSNLSGVFLLGFNVLCRLCYFGVYHS